MTRDWKIRRHRRHRRWLVTVHASLTPAGATAAPGDIRPTATANHLASGHGKAIFHRDPESKTADLVLVQRGGKWLTFQVVSAAKSAKDRFPATEVCERGSYRDNVAVIARGSLSEKLMGTHA